MIDKLMRVFRVIMLILGYMWTTIPMGTIEYCLIPIFFIIKITTGIDIDNNQDLKNWR